MNSEEQVCVIYAGVRGYLDNMETSEIAKFERLFLEFLHSNHGGLLRDIGETGVLTDQQDEQLGQILQSFLPSSGLRMK